MKLTYLGTAAAEGFPAVFCNCEHCQKARVIGGKNIRTRSQTLINGELLIDLPADTYSHFLKNGIEGHKIKYLLVTHSHQDHFYMEELAMRHKPFSHNMQAERIQVFLNKGSYEKLKNLHGIEKFGIDYTEIKPFETISFGDYKVTGLPAHHFEGDGALIYIIEQNGKKILYAHDTGYFYDEVFDYINEQYGDDEGDTPYDLSYFFGEDHVLTTTEDQTRRQLFAQYPNEETIDRLVVMKYFDKKTNERANRIWNTIK
jgi:phosphoribosyl 1,2-cyclic phosphate phosphodiesterase